jgi:hypothetical protein
VPSIRVRKDHLAIGLKLLSAALLAVVASVSLRDAHISAQDFPTVIGRIEGDDLEVTTTTPSGVERDASPTVVASGSDVTLRSGHALLMLNAGGEISVCGPAHFKLIQSSGSVTLALDYGRVHPSLESSNGFSIYTPAIVATPIAIAGGLRDTTLGLDPTGEMCVLASRGALRVEPQFAGQSMIVPQGGSASLSGGQVSSLNADASACSCDYPRAHLDAPSAAVTASASRGEPSVDIGPLASPAAPPRRKIENVAPPAASGKEPIYTVLMPALSFNANSPEPPPAPSPETIMLVREVRLRPLYEYRGRVNPAPAPEPEPTAVPASPAAPAAPAAPRDKQSSPPTPSLLDRLRNFFRRMTSDKASDPPCAGAGCTG